MHKFNNSLHYRTLFIVSLLVTMYFASFHNETFEGE